MELQSLFNKVAADADYALILATIETPTQVFSREYCEIFKNTYFE